jgi:hypothetical protein
MAVGMAVVLARAAATTLIDDVRGQGVRGLDMSVLINVLS